MWGTAFGGRRLARIFAKQFTKEWKEVSGKMCTIITETCVRQLEPKKSSESQKAKALWAMKAEKDRMKDFYDPARKDDILGRKQTSCGKNVSKTQSQRWTKL